ncbi:hypothetical protein C8Q75DRAFT_817420 [Abortiporus biennis]|nr:hypothetical protein C8Q75DRAFT_817420 [Abortiporus biennis]
MSASLPQVAIPKLDNTLGAFFVGLILTGVLYGVTCVQTYIYFMDSKKKDPILLRALLTTRVSRILDGLELAFASHVMYWFAISNYFNPASLLIAPWSASSVDIVANLNDAIVRGIFISRINTPTFLWIANLAVSSLGLTLSVKVHQIGSLYWQEVAKIAWLIYVVFTSIASLDTIIAATLCFILWRMRTGFKHTDSVIQSLIRYSIHTGALTSCVAISVIITYSIMPHNFIYIGIFLPLPKFYLNALLATLNARETLRVEMRNPRHSVVPLSTMDLSTPGISQPGIVSTTNQPMKFRPELVTFSEDSTATTANGFPADVKAV